jgi:hypothetical protein
VAFDLHSISEYLTDTIAALSHEIGRRVQDALRAQDHTANERPGVALVTRMAAQSVMIDYFLGRFKAVPFVLAEDGTWIMCLRCNKTSHNHNDVEKHYCAHCKRFLDDQH